MNSKSNIVSKITNILSSDSEINKYGSVPIIKESKKLKNKKTYEIPSVTHFIRSSTTKDEINNLLSKVKTEYKSASQKTIRKWEKIASLRLSEINTQ